MKDAAEAARNQPASAPASGQGRPSTRGAAQAAAPGAHPGSGWCFSPRRVRLLASAKRFSGSLVYRMPIMKATGCLLCRRPAARAPPHALSQQQGAGHPGAAANAAFRQQPRRRGGRCGRAGVNRAPHDARLRSPSVAGRRHGLAGRCQRGYAGRRCGGGGGGFNRGAHGRRWLAARRLRWRRLLGARGRRHVAGVAPVLDPGA